MASFEFLDLVIGLVFIYLIFSLAVSTIREIYANVANLRSENLRKWVVENFDQNGFGEKILDHPVIKNLSRKGRRPSYIPPELFTDIFFQVIAEKEGKSYDARSIKKNIENTDLLPEEFKFFLLQKYHDAKGDFKDVKQELEDWFNSAMVRIGGTYKKKSQRALFGISLVLVVLANVDSLRLIDHLHSNPEIAAELADRAGEFVKDSTVIQLVERSSQDSASNVPGDSALRVIESRINELNEFKDEVDGHKLPLGWYTDPMVTKWSSMNVWNFIFSIGAKVMGLIISALAISLGAPFWFEMLNKLVDLRGAGLSPQKAKQKNQ